MQGQEGGRHAARETAMTRDRQPVPTPAGWSAGATLAAVLFGLSAPFTIQSQVAVWLALLLILARPDIGLRPLRNRPLIAQAWLFYFLVQGISILFSQNPLRSLICLRGDWPVLYLPIFLGILQLPRARRWGLAALLLSAGLSGLLGVWQHATGSDPLGRSLLEPDAGSRFLAVGSLGGHLTYAGTLMTPCIAALALAFGRPFGHRVLWLIAGIASGAGVLASYSRSAWIGVLAGGLLMLGMALRGSSIPGLPHRNRWRLLIPAALLFGGAILVLAATPGLRERFLAIGNLSELPRLRLWATALRIFAAFPVFGAGLGEWKELFGQFRLPFDYMAIGHPHSDLLNVLVHSGFAGLLAFTYLWVAVLRELRRAPRRPAVVLWGVSILAVFLVAGISQCYFTDEEPAGIFWFLLAAAISEAAAGRLVHPAKPPSRKSATRRLEQRVKAALLPCATRLFIPRRGPALPDLSAARRILVVRQDQRLGNLVLITPFLQALRTLAPQAEITLLLGDRFAALLGSVDWIDHRIVERKRWLIRHPYAYPRYLRKIGRPPWDAAFELSNPNTHSFYNAFLTIASRAPARIGFDHPRSRVALTTPIAPPEAECHCSLAPLLLLAALGPEPPIPPLRVAARPAAPRCGPILLHPGGRGAKRWPASRVAALLEALAAERAVPLRLIGTPRDRALIDELRPALGSAGDTRILGNLAELIAELRAARLYVGCDAGPMHLAAALDLPTITLFVTSHPLRYAPLGSIHEALLLGEASRLLAAQASPAATCSAPPGVRAAPAEFLGRLCARRPCLAAPPAGAGPAEEISFVAARIRRALAAGALQA